MDKLTRAERRKENKDFRAEHGMVKYPLMSYLYDYSERTRATQNAKTPFNKEVKVLADVVYKTIDGEDLKMDIYLPTAKVDGKFPVVFEVPGGGWMVRNRKRRAGYASMYATMGAVVFVIEHRVSPMVHFPEPLVDVIDAYNFVVSLQDEYNLDLDKITVCGDSSGGHLGACLGVASVRPDYVEKFGLPTPQVKPARHIFISGAFCFDTMCRMPFAHQLSLKYFSGMKSGKEFKHWDLYKEVSPLNCLTPDFPTTYNNGGILDCLCSRDANRMADALTKAGVRNEYYVGKNLFNSGHCYVKRIPLAPARKDMLRIMTWYKDEMMSLGTDLSLGYQRVERFLKNYHKALKGKVKC